MSGPKHVKSFSVMEGLSVCLLTISILNCVLAAIVLTCIFCSAFSESGLDLLSLALSTTFGLLCPILLARFA